MNYILVQFASEEHGYEYKYVGQWDKPAEYRSLYWATYTHQVGADDIPPAELPSWYLGVVSIPYECNRSNAATFQFGSHQWRVLRKDIPSQMYLCVLDVLGSRVRVCAVQFRDWLWFDVFGGVIRRLPHKYPYDYLSPWYTQIDWQVIRGWLQL